MTTDWCIYLFALACHWFGYMVLFGVAWIGSGEGLSSTTYIALALADGLMHDRVSQDAMVRPLRCGDGLMD